MDSDGGVVINEPKEESKQKNLCNSVNEIVKEKWELPRQILVVIGPLLLIIGYGTVDGYSSILLHQLQDLKSTIQVDPNQASWIASSTPLVISFGCFVSGWLIERFGRRKIIILFTPIDVCGWLCLYFGTEVNHLIIGRFLNGLCIGICCPACLCYVGDVCLPKYRELLLSSLFFEVALGTFLTNLMGTFFTWRTTALVITVVPVTGWLLVLRLPESYVWYLSRNDYDNAAKSYRTFRREDLDINNRSCEQKQSFRELMKTCAERKFLKPLLISTVMFLTAQTTGHNAVVYYSLTIMKSSIKGLNEYVAMLTVDIFRVVIALMSCILVKKFKVRPLALMGGIGTSLSLYVLSLLIFLSDTHPDNKFLSIVTIFPFITDTIFISLGLLPMKWTLCGVIFPPNTRGLGNGLSTCVNFFAIFLVVKTNPVMTSSLGMAGSFAVYASLTLCGTTVLYWILPEVKNKSYEEVEKSMMTKKGIFRFK